MPDSLMWKINAPGKNAYSADMHFLMSVYRDESKQGAS